MIVLQWQPSWDAKVPSYRCQNIEVATVKDDNVLATDNKRGKKEAYLCQEREQSRSQPHSHFARNQDPEQ